MKLLYYDFCDLWKNCVVIFLIVVACQKVKNGTVYLGSTNCRFFPGELDKKNAVAYGTYNDTLLENGWTVLDIKAGFASTDILPDWEVMFAAGCLEGALTAEYIYDHYKNMQSFLNSTGASETFYSKLKTFFDAQDKWTRKMIQENPADPFWKQIDNIMSQFDGLVAGYNQVAKEDKELDIFAFQILNGMGDISDLQQVLSPETLPNVFNMSASEFERYFSNRGHCSALIKVRSAYEDIFMAHSTWFSYASTLRIYKHYNFKLKDLAIAARRMSFSSYPGFLQSIDDFYMMDSGLVMLQTTNDIFNQSLYKSIIPQSLFAWQRVRLANMMARNGSHWANLFARYNSGTYNNQYMVIDLNRIELGKTIHDDALWVVEQIPTLVMSGDQTPILRTGYWPSYNVPFYEKIFKMSGYPDIVKKYGTDYSYQLAPRAKIFRRDQSTVTSLEELKKIMRYNDYLHDPYSSKDPCKTICCRGDLRSVRPSADGCYDTKVTDYIMATQLRSQAVSGPTLGTGLVPFKWTSQFNLSHIGLPPVYNFSFVLMEPNL